MLTSLSVIGTCLGILLSSAATACSTSDDSVPNEGAGEDEVNSSSSTSLEGKLSASPDAITGFQLDEQAGPEDHVVVAVDFADVGLPGKLLAGKTLRIKGHIEKRQSGALPNGTKILKEVLVAREVIEPLDGNESLTGTLEKVGASYAIVVRFPENAAPADQDSNETLLELGTQVNGRSLLGKKVTATGTLAHRFTGAVGDRFLVSNDLLVVATLTAAPQ
jgi:hypothetical protein